MMKGLLCFKVDQHVDRVVLHAPLRVLDIDYHRLLFQVEMVRFGISQDFGLRSACSNHNNTFVTAVYTVKPFNVDTRVR